MANRLIWLKFLMETVRHIWAAALPYLLLLAYALMYVFGHHHHSSRKSGASPPAGV